MTARLAGILIFVATTLGVVLAMIPYASPQDADRGQIEFLLNCSRCHGTDAKGSGPDSAKLHIKPVDLTVLAKRNHGRFDPGAVYQMIDGRNARLIRGSNQTQRPTRARARSLHASRSAVAPSCSNCLATQAGRSRLLGAS